MKAMWAGRFSKELSKELNDFNSSIPFDARMYRQDIEGSLAHAAMLAATGILSAAEGEAICSGLESILHDLDSGALRPDPSAEDIHMFVEAELTKRIGDAGKRLHTARSRNDQVALDLRLYLSAAIDETRALLLELLRVLLDQAETYASAILPGYTHLQRAQPVTFDHHLMAYAQMFTRDLDRLADCKKRMSVSPLGSCALAGTTFPIDRQMTAAALGFDGACGNSLDGVSDRDFVLELASCLAVLMMHLSRFSEEIVLWCSWEFRFVELDDAYATGSSIMPQKKNPDVAELVRGKTGRAYGNLMSLLTVMKGLPLAYNKDMQEDKEPIFDSVDTVRQCLTIFTPMLATMRVRTDRMRQAASAGFINATDCADYLTGKGLPFRTAYQITGALVARCIQEGTTLEALPLSVYREFSPCFDEDVYQAIDLDACVEKRRSYGGTAPASVQKQIASLRAQLGIAAGASEAKEVLA